MNRTDEHRPSVIEPSEYEYVGPEYIRVDSLGDAEVLRACREQIREHMARTGGTYSQHAHGGNCMVCGCVHAVYTVLFYHAKSNSYIRMGSRCAEKCDMDGWRRDFNAFRKAVTNVRHYTAGKQKAEAILGDAGLAECWDIYEDAVSADYEERTIRDIVSRLVKWGSISDRQTAFLRSLLNRIETRAERRERYEREREAAQPVPVGRTSITGTVLKTESRETDFGSVLKMLVKASTGFLVWGTVPSGLLVGVELRGQTVRFTATFERSNDDPKFGFFRRPAKAELIQAS